MEMIERVARALCVADGMDPDHVPNEDGDDGSWLQWMAYAKAARSAIKAMRETPDAVVRINGSANWPKMIDAILAAALVTTPSKL